MRRTHEALFPVPVEKMRQTPCLIIELDKLAYSRDDVPESIKTVYLICDLPEGQNLPRFRPGNEQLWQRAYQEALGLCDLC